MEVLLIGSGNRGKTQLFPGQLVQCVCMCVWLGVWGLLVDGKLETEGCQGKKQEKPHGAKTQGAGKTGDGFSIH